MKTNNPERLLKTTFDEVKHLHAPAGWDYIKTHWIRYVHLVSRLPKLDTDKKTLEIGASIMSSLMRRRFNCETHTIYHELEKEWPARLEPDGIVCHPVELIRDELPVPDGAFDCILFNEVVEHLPLKPDFVIEQILAKLKPGGVLLFSAPNFATSEKRLALLCGKNPQDPMDETFVYYAHHREPVMGECVALLERCGGIIQKAEWCDCDVLPGWFRTLWHCLRYLRHGKFHRIIHQLVPSTRSFIIIKATRADALHGSSKKNPPLFRTGEFIGKPD